MRVDAHHHLWHYSKEEFSWIEDGMQDLRRDFLVGDLQGVLTKAHVDGAVVVQACHSLSETEWLLCVAENDPSLLGVVGWLPLASPDLARYLDHFASRRLLKGVRHCLQGEPDGFLHDSEFNRGVSLLQGSGLVYDILIYERQLSEAIRFVDRHQEQSFILDHMAKPKVAAREIEPWRGKIRELALRPNVTCKISGLVTEADPADWTEEQLQPYLDAVLEAFGPKRLMIGSDWPVLTLGCAYARWWSMVEHSIASLSPTEQADILGATALRIYNLQPSANRGDQQAAN